MADTPTHFFKFIRPPFNLNISIPTSFLPNLNLNGGRCSKAILRRGGHEWPVNITDGSFSGDGWKKCVRENGIQEFDFLVFKHLENMVFDFLVFDPSTCEKQYPNSSGKMDVEEPIDTESESEIEEKRQLGDDRCFVFKITPYSIKSSKLVSVPLKFARSNRLITKGIRRKVIIRDETRRTWSATLRKILSNNSMQLRLLVCREFKVKNHLKVGDTCMFELVKRGEVLVFNFYNVGKKAIKNYTRVKEETNSTIKKPIEKHTRVKKTNSTIKKATPSTANNHRYFTSTLKPCTFKKSILHIPVDFVRSNDLEIGKMILIDDKSRSWEVLLKDMEGGKRFYLGCSFTAFRVANELKEGDAYKFELVENENDKPPIVNFSCKKEDIVPKRESSLHDKDDHPRPYFISKLKPGNIKQSILYLPINFAKENGLFYNGEIIMRNGKDKRSWIVELKNHKNKYCYIGRGWKDFRVVNCFKEGDRFKLQIVDNIGGKLVMNFYT